MSKDAEKELDQKFADCTFAVEHLEKQLVKTYLKMEKAAFSAELAKCLSPVSTESEQHLKRISLLKLTFSKESPPTRSQELIQPIKLKKPSAVQDLDMISQALKLQHQKLGYYEFMHAIAVSLSLATEAELIEQTITDNRNTNTWLRQIVQHVIAPKLLD